MEPNVTLDNIPTSNEVFFIKPSLIIRIKSLFIDSMVLIFLMMIASTILTSLNIKSGVIKGIVLGMILLYEPIFTSLDRTLGQKMMGLRVRNHSALILKSQSKNINIFWSILRYFTKSLLGWVSLLTIHSNSYGKAIHDSIANSVMTLEN